MRRHLLVALLGIALLAATTSAWAATSVLEASPYPSPYGGETLEVPPGDIETLYFHITEPGLWHVSNWSLHSGIVSGTDGLASMVDLLVVPTNEYQGSVWYPFGVIRVDGVPSTTLAITIDLTVQNIGTINSNPIYKHITPEPSSILALGMGALGMGGLVLRRRRS